MNAYKSSNTAGLNTITSLKFNRICETFVHFDFLSEVTFIDPFWMLLLFAARSPSKCSVVTVFCFQGFFGWGVVMFWCWRIEFRYWFTILFHLKLSLGVVRFIPRMKLPLGIPDYKRSKNSSFYSVNIQLYLS